MRPTTDEIPFWVNGLRFAEGEDDDPAAEDDADDDDEDDEDDSDSDDDDSDDEDPKKKGPKSKKKVQKTDDDDDDDDDLEGLKSALRKERRDRKRLERELKAVTKVPVKKAPAKKAVAKTPEVDEETQQELAAAKTRNERLAAGFVRSAVNREVERVAARLGFQDPEDAVALVKRSDIGVEQDDDDPTEVKVDSDDIQHVLKRLLKKKPHLKKVEKTDEDDDDDDNERETPRQTQQRSGSKVGTRGNRGKTGPTEQTLRDTYPALGLSRGPRA